MSVDVGFVGSLLGELEGELVAVCGIVVIRRSGGAILGVSEGIIYVILESSSRSSLFKT